MSTITSIDGATDQGQSTSEPQGSLQRKIGWQGAFWVASGVPALVLFSIGAIASTVGKPAWLAWMLSITFGFIQAFTYAEIAGMFPNKSGGASVYGAIAWVRYSKFIAPVLVWCNWLAWMPVLSIGSGLAAGYILLAIFPADSIVNTWQITLLDLGFIKSGLSLRINATFLVGAAVLLCAFCIQHGGILRSSRFTMILGIAALIPLLLIGTIPLITGDVSAANFFPIAPLAYDDAGNVVDGLWNIEGWKLMAGGMFIAAWSTYAFETSICYTREFRNPKSDTFKAIIYSGLLCFAVFTLVPMAFQSHLGLGNLISPAQYDALGNELSPAVYDGMLAADIYSGMGVSTVLTSMVGGGQQIANVILIMLILALLLSIMTAMAGSSRTLYQGSVDGWFPRYLSYVNKHGAPTRAMWTDFSLNLVLLLMSDYVFVLAVSNTCYVIFNFFNLNAGWLHRLDRPNWERPYKAPLILIIMGAILSFVNVSLMGLGANIWGEGTLLSGVIVASCILPVFLFRHYIQDKGVFPKSMLDDLNEGPAAHLKNRAGILPFLTIALAVALVVFLQQL
ncbi:APC family permease [Methylobacillus sp. Pita1]|uniref:APC family permease n=1 Tax=Methylobacillus sp. Pita1 TaxID=3382642 RepID=UPI0038B59E49